MPGFDPITAVANVVNTVLDRVLPNKEANDAAKLQLAQMQLQGDLAQITGQLDIDKAEAASNSTFVAGWRPFIGWACGSALVSDMIVRPIFTWLASLFHASMQSFPTLDLSQLMPLMITMLGMGAMRSYDKTQGTGNGH